MRERNRDSLVIANLVKDMRSDPNARSGYGVFVNCAQNEHPIGQASLDDNDYLASLTDEQRENTLELRRSLEQG